MRLNRFKSEVSYQAAAVHSVGNMFAPIDDLLGEYDEYITTLDQNWLAFQIYYSLFSWINIQVEIYASVSLSHRWKRKKTEHKLIPFN